MDVTKLFHCPSLPHGEPIAASTHAKGELDHGVILPTLFVFHFLFRDEVLLTRLG